MVAVANASTPAVDPATVVEVVVAWGESVLHVAHLASANAAFSLGDRGNFALPAERLGTSRLDLVQGRAVLVPAHVTGLVAVGEQHMTLADARATGHIVDGRLPLAHGVRLRFEVGGFTVQVAMVTAAEKLSGRGPRRRLAPWALALLLHAGTLGALASSPRDSLDAEETATLDAPTRALLVAEDHELGGPPSAEGVPPPPGPASNVHDEVARALIAPSRAPTDDLRTLVESKRYGALGALDEALAGHPTLDFGGFELGHAPLLPSLEAATKGAEPSWLFGSPIEAPCGCGARAALAVPNPVAVTASAGPTVGTTTKGARAPGGTADAAPSDPEVDRTMSSRAAMVRGCFAAGRKRDPELRGTVTVRVVIDTTGATESVSTSGGTLADDATRTCIRQAFANLSFPAPAAGKAMTTYTWALEEPAKSPIAHASGLGGALRCACP